MQYYLLLKSLHLLLVASSILLLNLRFFLRVRFPHRPLRRLWQRLPHGVDILLLASGVTLAVLTHALPFFEAQWLGVKLVLLVSYILFGAYTLRVPARSKEAVFVYFMAMSCVLLMILVAVYKPSFWR